MNESPIRMQKKERIFLTLRNIFISITVSCMEALNNKECACSALVSMVSFLHYWLSIKENYAAKNNNKKVDKKIIPNA